VHLLHQYLHIHGHSPYSLPPCGWRQHCPHSHDAQTQVRIGINNWTIFFTMLDICLVITIYWQHCLTVTDVHRRGVQHSTQKTIVRFRVTAMCTSEPAKLSIITESREDTTWEWRSEEYSKYLQITKIFRNK
jgi:hypothetical protein